MARVRTVAGIQRVEMLDVLDSYIRSYGSGKLMPHPPSSMDPAQLKRQYQAVRFSVLAAAMNTLLFIIIAGKCYIILLQIIRHKMSAIGKVLSSYFDICSFVELNLLWFDHYKAGYHGPQILIIGSIVPEDECFIIQQYAKFYNAILEKMYSDALKPVNLRTIVVKGGKIKQPSSRRQ